MHGVNLHLWTAAANPPCGAWPVCAPAFNPRLTHAVYPVDANRLKSCEQPSCQAASPSLMALLRSRLTLARRARSSVVEHTLHTGGVASSILAAPTIKPQEKQGFMDGLTRNLPTFRCRNSQKAAYTLPSPTMREWRNSWIFENAQRAPSYKSRTRMGCGPNTEPSK